MKIDGKLLAKKVLADIKSELTKFPQPLTLAIVTLGQEDAWEHYVKQKIKLAKKLGVSTELINIKNPTEDKLIKVIEELNNNPKITGIIVQRPLTKHIKKDKVIYAVSSKKDIDGFIKDSYFKPPVLLAVKKILWKIYVQGSTPRIGARKNEFLEWLKSQNITVLGKGETAGEPVIDGLRELGIKPNVIDSKTENSMDIIKNSDVIISAVGKSGMFKAEDLKQGAIVIGIGLHREEEKLKPDFNEEEVSKIAKYYSPTPGGVGPLNLAYLFKNLTKAAQLVD